MKIRFARSATKHRIKRTDAAHVINNAIEWFELDVDRKAEIPADRRRLYLGQSPSGHVLEVIGVLLKDDELLVIHAMPIRSKFRSWIEEV